MTRSNADDGPAEEGLSRRRLLSLGAGAAGAAVGLGVVPGSAVAWRRFDAEFLGCSEVRLIVHEDDLHYDPPAVAKVVVAADGETDCRPVEITPEAATQVPDQYGTAPVIPYTAGSGESILGVLEYHYREDRFSEPVCLLANDNACASGDGVPAVREADCVQAGKAGYWNGTVRECPNGPIDGDRPVGDDPDPELQPLEIQKLAPADGADGDGFGEAVQFTSDSKVLLVGAPNASIDGTESGRVYVYRRHGDRWRETATLEPSDGSEEDRFGAAIDLDASGDVALVGAPDEGDRGAAHCFEYDGDSWTASAALAPTGDVGRPAENVALFGDAVALDGDGQTAVVGAPYTSAPALNAGAGYVYRRADGEWSAVGELVSAGGGDSQQFGRAVDVAADGERIAAGAPVPFPDTTDSEGWVGIYEGGDGTWTASSVLKAEDGEPGELLGTAVGCDDACDLVVAGNPRGIDGGEDRPGEASVFARDGDEWTEVGTLGASDGTVDDGFGSAVATSADGTSTLVGAPGNSSAGSGSRAVYEFQDDGTGFRETAVLQPEEPAGSFGAELSVTGDGTRAAVGAPGASVDGTQSGAVSVYVTHRERND